jgi:putative endonuclease
MSRDKGTRYEQLALGHLTSNGLKLVEHNFRCRLGEIDLVMRDNDCLVFVEVRYRSSNRFASAAHSVDERKQAKIVRTAEIFLGKNPRLSNWPVRFDVVAFDGAESDQDKLQWTRDAFRV